MMPVPNGLAPDVAALTEPMAVAWHAVRRGEVGKRDVAIVIGCGPVGLGVILCLKAKGVRTVVASDYSPGRRALARRAAPTWSSIRRQASPYGRRRAARAPHRRALGVRARRRHAREARAPPGRLVAPVAAGREARRRAQAPGDLRVRRRARRDREHHRRRAAVLPRRRRRRVRRRGRASRPAMAINKEIDLRFVLGYTPLEFRDTLHMLAEGELDPRPLVTGTVGLDGVDARVRRARRPRDARQGPDRPARRRRRRPCCPAEARLARHHDTFAGAGDLVPSPGVDRHDRSAGIGRRVLTDWRRASDPRSPGHRRHHRPVGEPALRGARRLICEVPGQRQRHADVTGLRHGRLRRRRRHHRPGPRDTDGALRQRAPTDAAHLAHRGHDDDHAHLGRRSSDPSRLRQPDARRATSAHPPPRAPALQPRRRVRQRRSGV